MGVRKGDVVPGARFEMHGTEVIVVGTGETVRDYSGAVSSTDGVTYSRPVRGGGRKTIALDRFVRAARPAGSRAAREDRISRIREMLDQVAEAAGDDRAPRDVFAAKMDRGGPCAQITLTEAALMSRCAQLDALTAAASAADDDPFADLA